MYEGMPDQSSSDVKELLAEENALYNRFHSVFTVIAPKEKVKVYNILRNDISLKKISQEDANTHVVKLLDFNLNK